MTHLFPTSIIGSMPRIDYVRQLLEDQTISAPERDRQLDSCIKFIVAFQEYTGLDVVSDGEWRRISYLGVIAQMASGFRIVKAKEQGKPHSIVVVGEVAPVNSGFIADEVRFLKGITDKNIKVCIPSPALLGERMWNPADSIGAYPNRRSFVRACVPLLREEISRLESLQPSVIQIDDPHLCLLVDEDVRAQYEDPDEEAAFTVGTINKVIEGFEHLNFAIHLCRRAGARARGEVFYEGPFDMILPHLNELKAQQLCLEFTAPGSGEVSVLSKLRSDFLIGLGCINVQPGIVDTVETIVERVESALKHVSADRIILNPDCGFSPSSTALVSLDEVFQKLKNETAAAAILRKKYG